MFYFCQNQRGKNIKILVLNTFEKVFLDDCSSSSQLASFQEHYTDGVAAYGQNDWPSTLRHMEQALTEFFSEIHRCQLNCEEQNEAEASPFDFYITIAGRQ